jgi:hypothetical protein
MMNGRPYKKRLIVLLATIVVALILQYAYSSSPAAIDSYATHIFRPFQHLRNILFAHIPFSIGDIIYLLMGVSLLVLIIKWIFFILNFSKYKHALALSALSLLQTITGLYIIFFLGWGGNYNRAPLAASWQLKGGDLYEGPQLYTFDSLLVARLNAYAPHYAPYPFLETSERAADYYRSYTNIPKALKALKMKPSLFGNLLEYMGVQGYYNPLTGESQLNSDLPAFLLPYVICHELAHQAGIAAEDDANLMAYAVATTVPDSSFRYSGYFNLWLYTHSRLKMTDSAAARRLYQTLNPLTIANVDTLRAINKRYRSKLSRYSNDWYDTYLRLHHVKDGIESYNDVVQSAWAWEQSMAGKKDSLIHIP